MENRKVSASDATESVQAAPKKKNKQGGFFRIFFTVLLSIWLTVSATLLILLLFLNPLSKNDILPEQIFGAWYLIAVGVILVLIPLILLFFVNAHRFRRTAFALGCSCLVSAACCAVAAVIETQVFQWLPGDWQDALVNVTAVFREYGVGCAIALILLAATCLSVYFCISAVKGVSYEKDV